MKKIVFYLIVVILLNTAFVMAQDTQQNSKEDSDKIIEDIIIKGNTTVEDKEILEKTSYGMGMIYSKYKTREDIKNLYKTGKFDDIKIYLKKIDGKNVLVYELKEKPRINKIIIKGNKEVGEGDIKGKLDNEEKEIKIKENEYFDEYKLKKAIIEIQNMYKEKNFYYAEVKYSINKIEPEKGKKGEWVNIELEISEGDKLKVKKITATGNQVFSVDKIKGVMKTKEEGWFVSGVFDDEQFIEDLKNIINEYYKEGYVKAKINGYTLGEIDLNKKKIINDYVKIDKENNAISIEIPVDEGIKYNVKSISVSGNEIFTKEEILDKIDTKEKNTFNKIQFDKDISIIRNMYAEKGHIFAQINDTYIYDDDQGNVDINLDITEGPVAYIDNIKIRGNYSTKDKVIRRELSIKPGDPFDSNLIRKSQEKIYNLGFFDNVLIDTEQVDIDKLNLIFEVKERKTGTIGLGAGYSSLEGLVGYVQLTESNLFGEGKLFSADVQVGNQKKSWQLSYKDPWLFDTPTSFGVDVWNTFKNQSYNNQGYDLDTYGFDFNLGRRFDDANQGFITYRYQEDNYSNIRSDLVGYISEGKSSISSITPMYVYDTRDDVFDPNRGLYSNLSLQIGGGYLGGDYNYLKMLWDGRYFIPSIWKFVLALHARIGNAWGYEWSYGNPNVPPIEKFYAGGTDTVRGYEERALGPVAGGNFLIVTNVEYKLKIVEKILTLAVFYDSGNCWENFNNVNWMNPYLYPSWGFGIRLTVPGTVMLIRLDWGYALDPTKRVEGGKIHFNIGNIF